MKRRTFIWLVALALGLAAASNQLYATPPTSGQQTKVSPPLFISKGGNVQSVNTRTSVEAGREYVPAFWPNELPEPKWPEAHPDAKPNPEMDRIRYWEKLCKLEAGHFIYRTAENVESIYLIRPYLAGDLGFNSARGVAFQLSRYVIEDPYLWNVGRLLRYSKWFQMSEEYPFVEMSAIDFPEHFPQAQSLYGGGAPIPQPFVKQMELDKEATRKHKRNITRDIMIRLGGDGPFLRYTRDPTSHLDEDWLRLYGEKKDLPHPHIERRVTSIQSKYGVYWRGISRPKDREMGIGGGEVLVIDLQTNEIMAVHRGFVLAYDKHDKSQLDWLSHATCPSDRIQDSPFMFLRRVLRSSNLNAKVAD